MERIRRIANAPTCRLILWGILKSLIVAVIASLALAGFVVAAISATTSPQQMAYFGTADQLFLFAMLIATVCSLPVAGITAILLSIFIREESLIGRRTRKRTFLAGILLGAVVAGIGILIFTRRALVALEIIPIVLAGLSGGLAGLWMLVDARRLWPSLDIPD